MAKQYQDLVLAVQREGGVLIPMVVDPVVAGVNDVLAGTEEEQSDAALGLTAWHRSYADSLAPAQYERTMRKFGVQGFFVNDLSVDDRRLEALNEWGIPYVAMGRSMRTTIEGLVVDDDRHPTVETDNRAGIAAMAQLLRAEGCESMGHIGFARDGSVAPHDRLVAVQAALAPGSPYHAIHYEKIVPGRKNNVRAVADWLKEHPTLDAVVCDSDSLADILRRAAPKAGRRLVRKFDAHASVSADRPLMTCGNDDSPVRQTGGPRSTWWMTMHSDRAKRIQRTVELMAQRFDSRSTAPNSFLVAPIIVGAPAAGPTDETKIAE